VGENEGVRELHGSPTERCSHVEDWGKVRKYNDGLDSEVKLSEKGSISLTARRGRAKLSS